MLSWLLALLLLGNGAPEAHPVEPPPDAFAAVEYTGPQCPSMADEPCYIILRGTPYAYTIDSGP